ncbi:MAG: PD-(D/E)XK nuclease family protein [Motiliproteus sp.]|nr:PD-(D/E)XK nuclease family protein [Motiliproteus sp.]MCW9052970.1 PD-(D/E)XK nuclease family protein [Motiliproteus sp.]
MNTLFDIQTLLPALQSGTLIITPNRRLAAKILASYCYHQQQSQRCWPTPRVYSLEAWISRCWTELQGSNPTWIAPQVLDTRQELLIWEQVITASQESSPLLKPSGAAQQAQSAYRNLQLWQQQADSELYRQFQSEGEIFPHWLSSFEQRCCEQSLITQTAMISTLLDLHSDYPSDAAIQRPLVQESEIVLVSFQNIPPLHTAYLDYFFGNLTHYQRISLNRQKGRITCGDQGDEIAKAGQWARQVLQMVPGASIGVIVPELQQLRSSIDRYFRQLFDPGYLLPDAEAIESSFNFSMGTPLSDVPVIHSALQLLHFKRLPLELNDLGEWLYSPFLPGTDNELDERVELEYRLRRTGKLEFWPNEVIEQINRMKAAPEQPYQATLFDTESEDVSASDRSPCGHLNKALLSLQSFRTPGKARPSYWGRWAHDLLQALGWPGERVANSLEYQQIEQWYELLVNLGRFDSIVGEISQGEAYNLIRKETQATVFQAKTSESALQILGPLEAAGLNFSHLWVMGISDDRWPAPASPNPLLPIGFQRQLEMPHATPERELEFTAGLTQSFIDGAETVIFSHPARRDDQQLRASALIAEIPDCLPEQLPITQNRFFDISLQIPDWTEQLVACTILETLDTGRAPAVDSEEMDFIRGGSSLIKNQALCPFQAFLIHRLGASNLEQPGVGISPAERGNSLHFALELFWKEIKDLQTLKNLSKIALEELINRCCDKAITKLKPKAQSWMKGKFWQLEHQRLATLLSRWLEVEKQRPDFTVLATEQSLNTQLAGLPLKLRIDRIDQLSDQCLLLIDYKTGKSHLGSWSGERPKEPQLPLYAISTRKPVAAIAFAEINAAEQTFKGFSDGDATTSGILPLAGNRQKLPPEWPELIQYWCANLEHLVEDFLHGKCAVDPVDSNAYQYSGVEPLNRIYEFDLYTDREQSGNE